MLLSNVMSIVFLGTDFQDSPFRTLERLERIAPAVREWLASSESGVQGSLVLSTCNRFELYLDTPKSGDALASSVGLIAKLLGESVEETSKLFRVRHGYAAVSQIFQVASGLESMVVGETEIVAQLRNAQSWARDLGALTTPLQRALDRALRVSKIISKEFELFQSAGTIIDTSLDLAQDKLPLLPATKVLVCGTGAYARVVLAALRRRGVSTISVYSRSGRGEAFARAHGVEPVEQNNFIEAVLESDLVIGASGASGYILTWEALAQLQVPERPIVLIDVALSRDIDPRLEYAGFGSIITLETIRRSVPRDHSQKIINAESRISDEVRNFIEDDEARSLDDAVASLRNFVEEIVDSEVNSVANRRGEELASEVRRSLVRVTNRVLHSPSIRARALARDGREEDYRRAIDLVFGEAATNES